MKTYNVMHCGKARLAEAIKIYEYGSRSPQDTRRRLLCLTTDLISPFHGLLYGLLPGRDQRD